MSLEAAIAANTAAIQELTAVWAKLNAQAVSIDKGAKTDGVVAAGKPVKAAAAANVAAATPAPETAKPTSTASPAASTKPAADYAPVGQAITAYAAANGRDATLEKLAAFNVKSGKELKPEQYADVLAAFSAEEEVA